MGRDKIKKIAKVVSYSALALWFLAVLITSTADLRYYLPTEMYQKICIAQVITYLMMCMFMYAVFVFIEFEKFTEKQFKQRSILILLLDVATALIIYWLSMR